jgi:hypothetical protein
MGSQSKMCVISTYCKTNCHHPFAQNRGGRLSQTVLLLHYNAHSHTAVHKMTTLPILIWNILNNPAYSSDLKTSDFHSAGLINKAVRIWSFTDYDTMKATGHYCPHIQVKTLYRYSDGCRLLGKMVLNSRKTMLRGNVSVITTRWIKDMRGRKYRNFLKIPWNFQAFT